VWRRQKMHTGFGEEIFWKESLGRLRQKWENNNKMSLKATGCAGLDWIHLAEDRDKRQALVNTVMNLQVPHPPLPPILVDVITQTTFCEFTSHAALHYATFSSVTFFLSGQTVSLSTLSLYSSLTVTDQIAHLHETTD